MLNGVTLCVLVAVCPPLVHAKAITLPFVDGPGADQCTQYLKAYRAGPSAYAPYVSWLQGYATRVGLEEAVKDGRMVNYLKGDTGDRIASRLSDWCTKNPTKSFYLAAVAFIEKTTGRNITPPTPPAPTERQSVQ